MDEQSIPIDINTNKLLDWLVSRQHIKKDWQSKVIKVREKINNAIQDMPEHQGIVKLLSGQHINYFHCLQIIEILKETEADTKNLFGRYGSQRMKDWQDIVYSYQKDNLYLAEAAQILIRNVVYEVPGVKKQIIKCEQIQSDCEKKIKEYTKSKHNSRREFEVACKELGIKGDEIKKELLTLLNEIPEIYERICNNIKYVNPAVEYYKAFTQHYTPKRDQNLLPILVYLIENGNTTTYEYTYREKPLKIEEPKLEIADDADNASIKQEETIDFGDNVQIDFGSLSTDNQDIDFGDIPDNNEVIDWGANNQDDGFEIVENIDFNINLDESGIVIEHTGDDGGVALGNDAFTILDNPKTRDQVITDLNELTAFLKMRVFELSSPDNFLISFANIPSTIQLQTIESVTSLNNSVQDVMKSLTNNRVTHLHNIKHSPKYVDILRDSLKQKLILVERMNKSIKNLEGQIVNSRDEATNYKPLVENLVEKTKSLKKQIEDEISKKYKGRMVNIVGAINLI